LNVYFAILSKVARQKAAARAAVKKTFVCPFFFLTDRRARRYVAC